MTLPRQDWVILCPDGQRRAMRRSTEIEAQDVADMASARAPAPCGGTHSMATPLACPGGAHRAVYDPPKLALSDLKVDPSVERVVRNSGEAFLRAAIAGSHPGGEAFLRAAMAGSQAHACAAEGQRLGTLYQKQTEAAAQRARGVAILNAAAKIPGPEPRGHKGSAEGCPCCQTTWRDRLRFMAARVHVRLRDLLGLPRTYKLLGPDAWEDGRWTSGPLSMRLTPDACVGLSREAAIATIIRLRREGYPYPIAVECEQGGELGHTFGQGVSPADLGYADDGTFRREEEARG